MSAHSLGVTGRNASRSLKLRRLRRSLSSYVHLLPFGSVYALFVIGPILLTIALSFVRWNGIDRPNYVGLDNYASMFGDDDFLKSFLNLLVYVAITVPLGVTVGLGLALFLDRLQGRWATFVRSAVFFPFIIPLFLTAVIWSWMYTPDYGLINQMLGLMGVESVDWLNDPPWMIPALVMADLWHSAGFNMLLIWAGLRSIPTETREAARIDGATALQETIWIILPQIRLVVFVVSVNALISAFQVFDLPWLLTKSGYLEGAGGADQALLFPVMTAVTKGLGTLRFGEASVVGVALLTLIVMTTALLFGIRRRWDYKS